MKTFLTILTIFSGFIVAAQDAKYTASGNFYPWEKESEEQKEPIYCLTLVSDANLREKPLSDATVVQKLPIASRVKIEEVTKTMLTLNGFEAPWCKIKLENGKVGYLWGGTLAAATFTYTDEYDLEKGLTYLVGVGNYDEKNHKLTLQMRAAKEGKELSKTEFISNGDLTYYLSLEAKNGSMGFDKVKDVIMVNAHYDACGYPSGDHIVFYQDNKLQHILETTDVADGGVFYSSEDAILPQGEGGIANHLVLVKDAGEFEEKGKDMVLTKQTYGITLYKWNGSKLLKIKELK